MNTSPTALLTTALLLLSLSQVTIYGSSVQTERSGTQIPFQQETEMMNIHTVKIGMAQIFCLDGDREGNFTRIEYAIQEATEKGAQIVCFPEMAVLGWVNPEAHQRAFPIPGEDTKRLCNLARQYNIFLCIGVEEKNSDQLHNSSVLIDDQGNLLLKHRKMNILSELMKPSYVPGTEINVISTKYGTIGMLICADTFVTEHLQRLAEQKPDLVLVPFGWAAPEESWPRHGEELKRVVIHAARAVNAPVVGTDLVGMISNGPWRGRTYGGQSLAVDKNGNILAQARDRDRDVVVVDVQVNR